MVHRGAPDMRYVSSWSTGTAPRTAVIACLIALVFAGPLFALQAPAGGSGARDSRNAGKEMLVRISEIEIHPNYLEEYKTL